MPGDFDGLAFVIGRRQPVRVVTTHEHRQIGGLKGPSRSCRDEATSRKVEMIVKTGMNFTAVEMRDTGNVNRHAVAKNHAELQVC